MIHTLPDEYRDLLERPLIGILATVSPDGRPSLQPMRFTWDGAAEATAAELERVLSAGRRR